MLLGPQWISLPALPHPRLEACLLHLPNVGPGAAGTLFSISGASETTDDGTLNTTTALAMSPGGPLAWVAGPAPIVGRRDLACTLLPRTSTVVVIGGSKGTKGEDTEFDTLEMLDVSSGSLAGTSWTTADVKLSPGRSGAAAAATPDGSAVVIVGGFCCMGKYLDEALLFDGVTLTKLAPFPVARASLSLVTLSQHGALLAFGGGALAPAYNETYLLRRAAEDGGAWSWSAAPALVDGLGRNRAASAVLSIVAADGLADEWVLTTGGFSLDPFFNPMSSTECFSANRMDWVQNASAAKPCVTTSLPGGARGSPSAAAVNGSCIVVAGGSGGSGVGLSVIMLCV